MEVRKAKTSDMKQIKKLWSYSFGLDESWIDWNLDKNFNPNDFTVISENGRIVSCIANTNMEMNILLTHFNVSYHSGLATKPDMRNRGLAKKLLNHAMLEAAENNNCISMIVPSDYKLFSKFGYRTTHWYNEYNIVPSDLPDFKINGNFVFLGNTKDAFERLDNIYLDFAHSKNAAPKRNKDTWRSILEDLVDNHGGNVALLMDGGTPVGYLLYVIQNGTMHVYEMAYITTSAHKQLLAFIKNHAGQVQNITIKAAIDDMSHIYFPDNRRAVTKCPFVMSRITDVFMAMSTVSSRCKEEFTIKIIDKFIPQNDGVFTMTKQGLIPSTTDKPKIVIDIGTLSQIFVGGMNVHTAMQMGLYTGPSIPLIHLFLKQDNYINMLGM